MIELPTGTVTFLFTDIEGATALVKELGEGYVAVLAEHDRILRKAVAEQDGREVDNQGDSFLFAFERANAALGAAVLAQRALSESAWPEGTALRVRMGLHTGEPIVGEERYVGLGVHRAARIGAVAHGGQVLLSNVTRELLEDGLAGVTIRDLGSYRLKDLDRDERLYQLDVAGLISDFPPLQAALVAEPRPLSPGDVQIGSEFVGYRIEELIGKGGMGVVYRAYDLRLKRTVALKLVTPELALDERFRERFVRETEISMSLEHPNVVPIHDAGDVAGRLYLAMRLVSGTDLRALLHAEGRLEPTRALAICGQVASALDAAHARGLVHRDVKPSNVLLDESEHVYLADFGLTRRLEEQSAQAGEGRSVGTPAYLAPEHVERRPVDARADIYSLGCLLYESLVGEKPFPRESLLAVAWAHLEDDPPRASERNPELPEAIDPVLRTAMAKEPDERFPTGGALIAAAEEALGLGRPPALRRGRRLALVAVGILVLLAAALAVFLTTRHATAQAPPPLFARLDTLARIDPATNAVSDVIEVGASPQEIAIGGRSVWVYNQGEATISEIDAETDKVRHTTPLSATATEVGPSVGPVLAADAGGAWFAGKDDRGSVLTRVRPDGRTRVFRLDHAPKAAAVGFGAVWIVGLGQLDNQLIRLDPTTGRVTHRTHFHSSPIDSIGVGSHAVWVVGSAPGMLYRINPRSGRLTGRLDVGSDASRPAVWPGTVEIGTSDYGGATSFVDTRYLSVGFMDANCCPPNWGVMEHANGWLWWFDWPTGSVYRQHSTADDPHQIRIVRPTPQAGGPCLTSIATGAGAVWVTAAATPGGFTCT